MINYASNLDKASKGDCVFATAVNCSSVESAYDEMQQTKEMWSKTGGIECFHLIQSFKPNETTSEVAHEIGIKLARRCFPNYEVVIGTHLDKSHIHNHLVWNSVSFADGKKYRNNHKDYFGTIRRINDELCREYGLSVIEKQQGRGKHYAEWKAEKEGKPTIRSMIRADIDGIIPKAINFEMFVGLLRKMGYKVKTDGKYITLLAPFAKKAIRLSSKLGEGYSVEEIKERISKSLYQPKEIIKPPKTRRYFIAKMPKPYKRYRGIQALYWHYVMLLRKVAKRRATPKQNHILRKEVLKMQAIAKQHNFLDVRGLKTTADVQKYWDETLAKIAELVQKRQEKKERGENYEEIGSVLQACRLEAKLCEKILENERKMQENFKELRETREKESPATTSREGECKNHQIFVKTEESEVISDERRANSRPIS